jgi:hypothetical protein
MEMRRVRPLSASSSSSSSLPSLDVLLGPGVPATVTVTGPEVDNVRSGSPVQDKAMDIELASIRPSGRIDSEGKGAPQRDRDRDTTTIVVDGSHPSPYSGPLRPSFSAPPGSLDESVPASRPERSSSSYSIASRKLQQGLINRYLDTLPLQASVNIRDLKGFGCAVPIVIIYHVTFVFFVVYFAILNSNNLVSNIFLSPYPSSGTRTCVDVPIEITNAWQLDAMGNWDTSRSFNQNMSIYTVTFQGAKVTPQVYQTITAAMADQLYLLSVKAASRDFMWSLLAWSSFSLHHRDSRLKFNLNGDVKAIFGNIMSDTEVKRVVYTSADEYCTPGLYFSDDTYASYDAFGRRSGVSTDYWWDDPSGSFRIAVPGVYVDNSSKPTSPCPNLFSMKQLGVTFDNMELNQAPTSGTVPFDARSIATALAVNYGIISLHSLVQVSAAYYASVSAYGSLYVDPKYPGMVPIFCSAPDVAAEKLYAQNYARQYRAYGGESKAFPAHGKAPGVCYYAWSALFYPIATSLGNCGQRCDAERMRQTKECTKEGLGYIGLILMPNAAFDTTGEANVALINSGIGQRMQKLLIDDPMNGDLEIQNVAYHALHASTHNNATNLKQSMDAICRGPCAMMTMQVSFDSTSVSQNFLYASLFTNQENGSFNCMSTMYKPPAISTLRTNPPVQLTQDYFMCHLSQDQAIIQGIGLAAGSANLYAGIVLSVMIFSALTYVNCRKPDALIVSPAEKAEFREKMLNRLLQYLMLISSNPHIISSSPRLQHLHQEMIRLQMRASHGLVVPLEEYDKIFDEVQRIMGSGQ